jgi:eukaryotic-like serine/threonine-protein kinase
MDEQHAHRGAEPSRVLKIGPSQRRWLVDASDGRFSTPCSISERDLRMGEGALDEEKAARRDRKIVTPSASPAPPASSRPAPASLTGMLPLGRLTIEEAIGRGGMATVHRARLEGPGGFRKRLAIKRIHPWLAEQDEFIDMFLDEARLAAAIEHPNVAQVIALGKDEATYWLAMEYLDGLSLREVMTALDERGRRMIWPVAAQIIAGAADGLHAAHELVDDHGRALQVVHRDATPHNVFITYEGAVKVVDFGVAKALGRLNLTVDGGLVKGKLAYMSPEQVAGAEVDRRTDVFALGVVLWELVTGRRLFWRQSDVETYEAVRRAVVPAPRVLRKDCPATLERIIVTALATDLDARYPTAHSLAQALRQLLVSEGLVVPSTTIGDLLRSFDAAPSRADLEAVTRVLSPEPPA